MQHALSLVLPFALLFAGAGCSNAVDRAAPAPRFLSGVSHVYFPLTRGVVRTYEGTDPDGLQVLEEVRTLQATRAILGVDCTAMEEMLYVGGALIEVTTEWYAQDHAGNVWKFGEESLRDDGGSLVETEDSWLAGVGDMLPWIAFAADPHPGDRLTGYRPHGTDEFLVASTTVSVKVPAGTFTHCLEVVENPEDPADQDIILYAPGMGRVRESGSTGTLELVSVRER